MPVASRLIGLLKTTTRSTLRDGGLASSGTLHRQRETMNRIQQPTTYPYEKIHQMALDLISRLIACTVGKA